MRGFLSRVADGQRLGMKMKLHCERPFAAPAKLATSGATNGNLPVRRGAARLKDNKGALRMTVGMRVRGGLFAALILVAMPVAADGQSDARRAYIGTNNGKAGEVAGKAAASLRPDGGKTAVFVGVAVSVATLVTVGVLVGPPHGVAADARFSGVLGAAATKSVALLSVSMQALTRR